MTGADEFTFLDMELDLDYDDVETPVEPEPVGQQDVPPTQDDDTQDDYIPADDDSQVEDPLISLANGLLERQFFKEIPETVDPSAFTEDAFYTTIEHNTNLRVQDAIREERESLVGALTGVTQSIMAYDIENPNATDEEIFDYMQATLAARDITSLDVEKDAERIVRQYYGSINWTSQEVEDEVRSLIASDKLTDKARALKPKLDMKAQEITQGKLAQQRAIADAEARQYQVLQKRTMDILKEGQLNGIPLTREEAQLVYAAVMNNDVDVPVKGGKTVKLGLMEALVHKHRFTDQGNLENLMLAALVMEKGPEAVKRFIEEKAAAKQVELFTRESKGSVFKKANGNKPQPKSSDGLFRLKLN